MTGPLSQLFTLCSAANGFFAGRLSVESFYPDHVDFKFCNEVRFVDLAPTGKDSFQETPRYANPPAWLEGLADVGSNRAWLQFRSERLDDHRLTAFVGGGGEWQLLVSSQDRTETWVSRWEVTRDNAPDQRIWGVTYGRLPPSGARVSPPEADLEEAMSRLRTSLEEARAFADRHSLDNWTQWFERALSHSAETNPPTYPDWTMPVCLDSYPPTAQRLLAASYGAWVFGGMGSWNDLGWFDDPADTAKYEAITQELYAAVVDAIQQVSWSFGRGNE